MSFAKIEMLQSKLADAYHVPRSLERVFGTEGKILHLTNYGQKA
jgi:hypothetical protein